ncbi:hypothetical protein VPH35_083278 [Triticum aestivum]
MDPSSRKRKTRRSANEDDPLYKPKRARSRRERDAASVSDCHLPHSGWGSGAIVRAVDHRPGRRADVDFLRGKCCKSTFNMRPFLGLGPSYYPAVADSDMGGLLTTQIANDAKKKHYAWILSRFNPHDMSFRFRDEQICRFRVSDMVSIMGFRNSGESVTYDTPPNRAELVEQRQDIVGLERKTVGGLAVNDILYAFQ